MGKSTRQHICDHWFQGKPLKVRRCCAVAPFASITWSRFNGSPALPRRTLSLRPEVRDRSAPLRMREIRMDRGTRQELVTKARAGLRSRSVRHAEQNSQSGDINQGCCKRHRPSSIKSKLCDRGSPLTKLGGSLALPRHCANLSESVEKNCFGSLTNF